MGHTSVYNTIEFADPFKQCVQCGAWVDGVLCIEGSAWENLPCGHAADYRSLCPSWSPVDGCCCAEHFGHVPHPVRNQES